MRYSIYTIIFAIMAALTVGCTESAKNGETTSTNHKLQPSDTLYTVWAAMDIFAYQPERALQIIDSAVIVGNCSEVQADQCRARIYSMTQMYDKTDSLLGGPKDVRLDTAQAIGERLLQNDTIKANLIRQKDVLEILAHTERMKNDTIGWLQRSRQLVSVCRQIGDGASADALRTEAEIGTALFAMGQEKSGMAKLDSGIDVISKKERVISEKFSGLDALIIALKRKIMLLVSRGQYAETLPPARLIIEQLNKYEQNPDDFHDGSPREPKTAEKRADYIAFYRNQALNHMAIAYVSLGDRSNIFAAFEQIERNVREMTAREHIARYHALQQQMEAERERANAAKADTRSFFAGIIATLLTALALVLILHNRIINRKNHLLAQQIAENLNYKKMYWQEHRAKTAVASPADTNTLTDTDSLTDEQLFQKINEVVMCEQLYLDSSFGRQTIMDRFHLSKERVGSVFTKGSEYDNITSYTQQLRLIYAAHLLVEQPEKSIVEIAAECGFSTHTYFSGRFRQHFGISPTNYRREAQEQPSALRS